MNIKPIKKASLLVATLALITACAQTSTTTSQKPTSSQKPTTPTTEPTHEKTLTSISVATTPSKTEYELGTKLDLAGAQLKITYSDGTTDTIAIKDNMISAVDMNTSGSKTVTVTYKNKTATFKITVKEKPVIVPVSVHFAKDVDHITIGGKLVLAPVVSPAGAELVWHSSNEDIATVADGVVSAKAYGNVIISVTQKGSDEVLATTKVFVLRQTAAPVNWAKYHYDDTNDILVMLSGGTMPNFTEKGINNGVKQLIIDAAVGEDQLTLSGLKAAHVEVRGGSATSIIFSNCTIGKLTVAKESEKPVRVELNNKTKIDEVALNSVKAILTAKVEVPVVKVVKEANIQATETIKKVETAANVKLEAGAKVEALEVKSSVSYDSTTTKATVQADGTVAIVPATATSKTETLASDKTVDVEVAGTVEKVVNEVKDTKVTGTGTVDVVETNKDMKLGDVKTSTAANPVVKNTNTGEAVNISNPDETVTTKAELAAGEKKDYNAAEPDKSEENKNPVQVGDHIEVYNGEELTAAFKDEAAREIALAAKIVYDRMTNIKRPVVLDLNGYDLEFGGNLHYINSQGEEKENQTRAFQIIGGELTVKNSKAATGGKMIFSNNSNVNLGIIMAGGILNIEDGGALSVAHSEGAKWFEFVHVIGNQEKGENREAISSVVNIKEGGKIEDEATGTGWGLTFWGKGAVLNMTGGEINLPQTGMAISGNGRVDDKVDARETVINISGGKITADEVGIYHPQAGQLNITGGEIKAYDAVYIKSGDVNVDITGGKLISTATGVTEADLIAYDNKKASEINANGSDPVGAALTIIGQDAYTGSINVNIKNATFEGDWALYERNWKKKENEEVKITVADASVFDGKKIHAENFKIGEDTAVSTEKGLNAAFASEDVTSIKLFNDIQLTGTDPIVLSRDITIDGGNKDHKHTVNGVKDNIDRQFQITNGNVTFQHMKLTGFGDTIDSVSRQAKVDASGAVIFVKECAAEGTKLIVDDVTIDHYNRYAIDARAGSFEIKNSTFDGAVRRGYHFNVGLKIGVGKRTVTGIVDHCVLTNHGSDSEEWSADAIEISTGGTDITVKDCTIKNSDRGFTVSRYYGPGEYEGVDQTDANVKIINCNITEGITLHSIRLHEAYGPYDPKYNPVGKATITIEGGTYSKPIVLDSSYKAEDVKGSDGGSLIVIKDGNFTGDDAEIQIITDKNEVPENIIQISGGKFESKLVTYCDASGEGEISESTTVVADSKAIQVTGGTFDQDPTSYIAEGYKATKSGEGEDAKWTVSKKAGE